MATKRKPTTTINANHDGLLAKRKELRQAVADDAKDEASAAMLVQVQRCVLASRKLRLKLGGDTKLPNVECDATKAETVEQFTAIGDALAEACKG